MKVFVTGVNGQLGYDVINELARRRIPGVGSDLTPVYNGIQDNSAAAAAPYVQLDITDKKAVSETLKQVQPDAVIHCAAWTAVDKAEDNRDLCLSVNAGGTRNIAEACREIGAKMLYISTDYVFPGMGDAFYRPEDPTGPLGVYGSTKLAGEQAVQEVLDRWFIVRISWVFGKNGNNFVKTMLRLAESRTELNVVCDQNGSPTYTEDLAPLLCDMAESDKYGIYHATNEGVCSWAEFAQEIFRLAGKNVTVHPIPTSQYPTRAVRPLNSRMSKDKLEQMGFRRLPPWQDALNRYLTDEWRQNP